MNVVNKKASILVMLMLVLALVVSACGNNNNAVNNDKDAAAPAVTNDKTDTNTPAAEPVASDLKPYKLVVVYEGPPQADEKKVEEALNKILTEKINATIDIAPIDWGAWDDKMNLMIASREPVDVMFTAQWNGHAKNVAKGAYIPLNDLLEQHGQGILETLDPAFIAGSKVNGKNYGIPTNKELASVGGIVYRKDIAEELGLDMASVKTPEDLGAIFATLKEKKPDMIPLYTTGGLFNAHYFAEFDFLGDGTIPGALVKSAGDTKVQMLEDMDIYKRYLGVARDFFVKGYINGDAATTQLSSQDAYKAGNIFSTVEPLKPGKADEIANAAGISGKLEQISMTGKTVATSETAGAMLAISSTSKDPERAMMFINLLHTDKEINNLLSFGIEGEHYTLDANGIATATDKAAQYAPGVAWELGNQFLNHIFSTENPDKWNLFKEFNSGAVSSPALGFVFDGEPVKAEVGALANVIKQYQKALETGSVDSAKVLPEYVAALKAAGVDKVIAEKQAQFDKFLAAK
ncbi:MAG: ABC transporter substrate-binding protein [Paenibacillaceae bacterium]